MNTMKHVFTLLVALAILSEARSQDVKRDFPYANPAHERQVLDVYSPHNAKNLPVVFWIHGGGWQTGDKTSVQIKPQVFVDKGFVFVSTNYRLLPSVDMATIVRDIARSIRWVHDHIAEHGGDPKRLFIMGHSAGPAGGGARTGVAAQLVPDRSTVFSIRVTCPNADCQVDCTHARSQSPLLSQSKF